MDLSKSSIMHFTVPDKIFNTSLITGINAALLHKIFRNKKIEVLHLTWDVQLYSEFPIAMRPRDIV